MNPRRRCLLSFSNTRNAVVFVLNFFFRSYLVLSNSAVFFIHEMHDSIVFLTASRAYGMYESEYHVIARDCIIINRRANPALCNCEQKKKGFVF